MPAKRSKTPAHRFTGCPPPAELLLRLPNWEFALDEEGVNGQDEYTLRPAVEQGFLSGETTATAVEGRDANGRDIVGLIFVEGMRSTGCDSAWIWTDAKGPAVYLYTGRREEDGQFHGLAELLSAGIVLPLELHTRVPLQPGLKCSSVKLDADGLTISTPEPGVGDQVLGGASEATFPCVSSTTPYEPLSRHERLIEFREAAVARVRRSGHALWTWCDSAGFTQFHRDLIATLFQRAETLIVKEAASARPAGRPSREMWPEAASWREALGLRRNAVSVTGAGLDAIRSNARRMEWLARVWAENGATLLCLPGDEALRDLPECFNTLPWFLEGASRLLDAGRLPAAKRWVGRGGLVLQFYPWADNFSLAAFGPDACIENLARRLITDERLVAAFQGVSDGDMKPIAAHEWEKCRLFSFELREAEKPRELLRRAMRAGVARPNNAEAVCRAIIAAELIAARVTCRPLPPGLTDLTTLVAALPPPDPTTLALARNAVCAVARGCRCPEAEFHTEAARQSWRDALADLHARLSG